MTAKDALLAVGGVIARQGRKSRQRAILGLVDTRGPPSSGTGEGTADRRVSQARRDGRPPPPPVRALEPKRRTIVPPPQRAAPKMTPAQIAEVQRMARD